MKVIQRVASKLKRLIASKFGSAAYWSVYTVVDQDFRSRKKSLDHFYWRSTQYVNYLELMPVKGFNDRVILDYGCGPGNDIIGFIEHSAPKRLIGAEFRGALWKWPSLEQSYTIMKLTF